jgi:hypothetical protein
MAAEILYVAKEVRLNEISWSCNLEEVDTKNNPLEMSKDAIFYV